VASTDSPSTPRYVLRMVGYVSPRTEVLKDEPFDSQVRMGDSGEQTYRIVRRSSGLEEAAKPGVVKASELLRPHLKLISSNKDKGIQENVYFLHVDIDATYKLGPHKGEILIPWGANETLNHPIDWTVQPCITISPQGITLNSSQQTPIESIIRLRSTDGLPFHITAVRSPNIAVEIQNDNVTGQEHTLRLMITGRSNEQLRFDKIEFVTDHPTQEVVALTVLAETLPQGAEQ